MTEPPASDIIAVSDDEALVLIEEELRRRHVAQRATGLIRLPRMLPKPQPPPEFWTQTADAMSAAIETPQAKAADRLRAIMRARRYDAPLPTEESNDG